MKSTPKNSTSMIRNTNNQVHNERNLHEGSQKYLVASMKSPREKSMKVDPNFYSKKPNNITHTDNDDMSSVGNDDHADGEDDEEDNYDFETERYRDQIREEQAYEYEYEHQDPDEELSNLIVDGYVCPPEFLGVLSPMEFEEIVGLFKVYDTNGDNTIDKHEVRKVLLNLGLDSSLERAEELLALVDKENTGEIGFGSFCRFIVLIKQGDDKMNNFKDLLSKLKDTPLGQLEHQAKLRNLKVNFIMKSEQEGTSIQKKSCIVELHLSGIWQELVNGVVCEGFNVKRFQGIGKSSREAKYNAATNALIKLGDIMPGIKFKEGDFPEEWLSWVDENLGRGIDPINITTILASKGFHPHRNLRLMQRIITWQSFDKFLSSYPELDIISSAILDPIFKQWVTTTLNHGIDGEILLKVLSDRSFDLMASFPHFAQKVLNNELGTVTDMSGKEPALLDFFQACEMGYVEEVELYCSCRMPVNEETISRTSSETLRPIALASAGGHTAVVNILLKYHADVNALDRRGRTALHLAASKGHIDTCNALINAGAYVFRGDHQGNSPLHLAALSNHYDTINFLAQKSQDLTRYITTDKIRVNPGMSFDQLVEKVFNLMPELKLKHTETQRFEKLWLCDTANKFIELCDKNVQFMLPDVSTDIMLDVLDRFDPRPETGILLSVAVGNQQNFIPTIPGPEELSVLLRRAYYLASIDPLNNFKRTPLHLACDANHINSHEKVIDLLIERYGCNLLMKDRQGRMPLDLLILERNVINAPSATKVREDHLIERREVELQQYSNTLIEEERIMTENRQLKIMNECIRRGEELSDRLWHVVRAASILKTRHHDWEIYEDPDTLNYFYCRKTDDPLNGIQYIDYSWIPLLELRYIRDRHMGLQYQRLIRSQRLRKIGIWEMLQCSSTAMIFYYDPMKELLSYKVPIEAQFITLVQSCHRVDILGFSSEWEQLQDIYENIFYRNTETNVCQWERPIEAVKVTDMERFCTAHQKRDMAIVQRWYTCEQCNRAWNGSAEGMKTLLKLCEPCVYRCHKSHKGVRPIRVSAAICNCEAVGNIASYLCQACTISPQQLTAQANGELAKIESKRKLHHDISIPPILAMVPPYLPLGEKKVYCGWLLCRRVPVQSLEDLFYNPSQSTAPPSPRPIKLLKNDSRSTRGDISPNSSDNEEQSLPSSIYTRHTADHASTSSSPRSKQTNPSMSGFSRIQAAARDVKYDFPYKHSPDLSPDWVEVYDPEQPEELPIGGRVIVKLQGGLQYVYGTIISVVRQGFYSIEMLDGRVNTIFRGNLELISCRIFYFNIKTGESAWTVEDAMNQPYQTQPLSLSGNDWINLYEKSALRREFHEYDEMFHPQLDFTYYIHIDRFKEESAARRLQNLYRQRYHKPQPITPWLSQAFIVDIPTLIYQQCQQRAGWAYLRRRSRNMGEFRDIHGIEWEEYVDKNTAEYFYWTEETNAYQWDKPPIPDRKKKGQELLQIGQEVLYKFPKYDHEEIAVIDRLRFDDQTGEDHYDLHPKYRPDMQIKWVPHIKIKHRPLEGDALILQRFENNWIRQIRRNRETNLRRKKREREKIVEIEMSRLREIKIMQGIISEGDEVVDGSKIMRNRVIRIDTEAQDERDDHDRNEGAKRRQLVKDRVDQIKSESTIPLSRADILSISRAVDMQVRMMERMQKQHDLQQQLQQQKRIASMRFQELMDGLRDVESRMTTPRSNSRRHVIRQVHASMRRQHDKMIICEWGCGEWARMGYDQTDHHLNRCRKRILPCSLGCDMKMTEDEWLSKYNPITADQAEDQLINMRHNDAEIAKIMDEEVGQIIDSSGTVQHHHETNECQKRLVYCPRQCLEWVAYEDLNNHMDELCTKRPAKPIFCRLGCGEQFGGVVEKLIQSEDERLLHESEECVYRMVRCNWRFEDGKYCAAQLMAKDRDEHRDYHLALLGVTTYAVPGTYIYKVPSKVTRLKVQVWGAGGGSGYFKGRRGGHGGGGAFVEILLNVDPYEVLEVVVGSGGCAGVTGTEIEFVDLDIQRAEMQKQWKKHQHDKSKAIIDNHVIDAQCGVTGGGAPGGGYGYGGSSYWAAGGGGGYSIVSKRTPQGNQALAVGAGGGGGSSLDGLPGAGMDGLLPGTRVDIINGGSASCEVPGKAGWSGTVLNSKWPATDGEQWKGGDGSEYGAGGGGGYFGGGGGGTTPGIGGSGGGGASYVYLPKAYDHVIIHGHGVMPGGLNHGPPDAVGVGEWDKTGGVVGQGGAGDAEVTNPGNNGCVRIFKPGHF